MPTVQCIDCEKHIQGLRLRCPECKAANRRKVALESYHRRKLDKMKRCVACDKYTIMTRKYCDDCRRSLLIDKAKAMRLAKESKNG